MEPKKKALKFTLWMIAFYFLNTSILCWFSGQALDDIGFYIAFLVLDAIALYFVIKIILSPHIVKSNTSHAPTAILSVAVVICLILITTVEGFINKLEIVYLFLYLSSMAFLIWWYKRSGIVEPKRIKPDSIIYDDYNQVIVNVPEKPKSPLDDLIDLLKKSLTLDQNNPQDYKKLKEALELTQAIQEKQIDTPKNIISQMINIIYSYNRLSSDTIKTQKVEEALIKIRESFPIIVKGLTAIYDSGLEQNLRELEVETETLENLLVINGLANKNKLRNNND